MRILAAQINPTVGDLKGNAALIKQAIQRAQKKNADLLLLPELCLTGYPPEDFLLHKDFLQKTEKTLKELIPFTQNITALIGTPRLNPVLKEKEITNSAAILQNGRLLGYHDKELLPTYDVFDEKRYFEPSHESKVWPIAGKTVGLTICEDLWQHSNLLKFASYRRDPVLELKKLKPDIVINLSASPFNLTQINSRIAVCAKAAQTLSCPVILCNQVGGNDSLIFDGHSVHVNSEGELVALAKGFQEDDLWIDTSVALPPLKYKNTPMDDLYHALVLGLHDYFRKSGFTKACIGMSGGIDSALVACIAAEALGPQNILGILMPSRFSSEGSIVDAEILLNNLKISSKTIPIEEPFKSFLDLLEPHFEERPFNVAEENFQARIRGMILMGLSNKFGYIVLSTGNKSEMAMGYATLYGDMCGGLGVINDVTKTQVYELARWINRTKEIIPWNTINKPPSAELRPNQKDSDTLPPYEMIDNVLKDYMESLLTPEEIAKKHQYPLPIVTELISKIHHNEYKRRQAPPGLRVSEKAFSVGRHFPIVQKWL